MYKIRFDTDSGKWIIQIAKAWGLWWSRVLLDGTLVSFQTYDDAQAFVTARGIDKVYADRTIGLEFDQYRLHSRYNLPAEVR